MKETFLVIIPYDFEDCELEDDMQKSDLSMYKVNDTLENLEERLTSMLRAGLFDTFIILPMNDFDQLENLEVLEREILRYRMENLKA